MATQLHQPPPGSLQYGPGPKDRHPWPHLALRLCRYSHRCLLLPLIHHHRWQLVHRHHHKFCWRIGTIKFRFPCMLNIAFLFCNKHTNSHQQPQLQPGAPSASPSASPSVPPASTPGGMGPSSGPSPHVPTATVPSPYLRQELHHHQHQHTHLHQHQQLLPTALAAAPPPAPAPLFPPPLFKDIPKIAAVESPFYRTGIGLPGYTGYTPAGLIHPGLGGATPFMPPSHLTSFAPRYADSKMLSF
ncbi:hypothetical protein EVAR_71663_1 [Eumeta japonica]|uniref:Uncharacterized protein n=1 Tax=Eumeta variegata TaxID=151549 RepID=A0A4C1TEE3_EUMVA|nr:hypothetical protein EVAR_71663_1 [Eumeta japonica]